MHQQRSLAPSTLLLLLSCHLLRPVPGDVTDPRPFGTAAHHWQRLPPDKVDYQLRPAWGRCGCKKACFVVGCFCYTVVEGEEGALDCYLSKGEVMEPDMLTDSNATTTCHSDYLLFGERFYRIYYGLYSVQGLQTCSKDGAQLAVVNTEQKKKELVNAAKAAGVDEVWVALRYDYIRKLTEWYIGNGETKLLSDIERTYHHNVSNWFTVVLTGAGPTFSNTHNSRDVLPLVCQRDY